MIEYDAEGYKGGVTEINNPKGTIGIAKFGRICGVFFIFAGLGGSFQAQGAVNTLFCLIGLPIFGISLIVSGTFMIRLKQWARYLFIVQMCIIGAKGIWVIIELTPQSHFSVPELFGFSLVLIPVFLLPMFCVYYLTRPKVKEQFK